MFTSLDVICFKFRTEEPNGWHTVWYCLPSQLVTGSSLRVKLLGTERQTHASCDSISWGGNAVRSAAENLVSSTSLSDFEVFCFVSSLDQEAQIGHFVVNRSKNGDLETSWKDMVGSTGSLQSSTGTFSSQVTNCSWSVPSCSQYPPLKENYWHVPCLQFHGSLQFKAFQSVHVKHEEPEQSGWAHRPSCRSLSESPVSKVSESAEHSKTCFF